MCSSTHPVALGHYSASPDEKYDSNLLLKMVIRSYSYWKVVFDVSKIFDHPLTPRIALSVCSYMCIHLFVSLFLCPSVPPSNCAPFRPFVHSFVCLFVCSFVHSWWAWRSDDDHLNRLCDIIRAIAHHTVTGFKNDLAVKKDMMKISRWWL